MFLGIDGIMYAGMFADLFAAIVTVIMARIEFKDMRRLENKSE